MIDVAGIIKSMFQSIGSFFFVKFWPSFVIPVIGLLFGFDSQQALKGLLVLIVIDFVTGILSAQKKGEVIKSRTAVRSAFKVVVYAMLVSAGHITEQITPIATYIEEAVITFLALTELISVIENVGKMGYAIPKKLLTRLQRLRDEGSNNQSKL